MQRRSNGKVARLPEKAREVVNASLKEGIPYATIVQKLKMLGHSEITTQNIQNWKQGGYREWLAAQERLALAYNLNCKLLEKGFDNPRFHTTLAYSSILLSLAQMLNAFQSFNPAQLQQHLAEKPERYFALVLAFTRMLKDLHAVEEKLADEGAAKRFEPVYRVLEKEFFERNNISNHVQKDAPEAEPEADPAEDEVSQQDSVGDPGAPDPAKEQDPDKEPSLQTEHPVYRPSEPQHSRGQPAPRSAGRHHPPDRPLPDSSESSEKDKQPAESSAKANGHNASP